MHSQPLYEVVVEVSQRAKNEHAKYPCSSKTWKIKFISFLLHNKLSNDIAKTKQNCKHRTTYKLIMMFQQKIYASQKIIFTTQLWFLVPRARGEVNLMMLP